MASKTITFRGNRFLFCLGLVGLMASLLLSGEGQALSPNKNLHQYVLRAWTTKDGMPNAIVSSVCRTDDGYLWVGTQEGLARFDGHSFRIYSSATNEEFGSNWIWRLDKDPRGRLWIATYNAGVVRYENRNFQVFRAKDGLTEESVRSFAFDQDGSTWVGTKAKGLFRFDPNDRITRVSKTGVGLGLSFCRKFARLYGGELKGENAPDGPGAIFTLTLPFASRPSIPLPSD